MTDLGSRPSDGVPTPDPITRGTDLASVESPAGQWVRLRRRLGNQAWLVPSVWLLFLGFPVVGVVGANTYSTTVKVVALALIALLAIVYGHGFHLLGHGDGTDVSPTESAEGGPSVPHFIALVVLTAVLGTVVTWYALSLVTFIVAFATFHLPWRGAVATLVAGLFMTIVVPAIGSQFSVLWFSAVAVAGVGAVTFLARIADERYTERFNYRQQLALSDERARVARDVHDVLGHSLTVVILKAELCRRLLDAVEPSGDGSGGEHGYGHDGAESSASTAALDRCRQELAELHSVSREALAEIRTTVGGLRSATLDDELAAARAVLTDAGVMLLVSGDPAFVDPHRRGALGWVVRESMTNIVRHAQADRCLIDFPAAVPVGDDGIGDDGDEQRVAMRIVDNGVGLDHDSSNRPGSQRGTGLHGLRERVEAAGGSLTVSSPPTVGTGESPPSASGTQIEVRL